MIVYWNGEFTDEANVHISPWDLGFLRGYGVFDYLAVYNRRPFMAEDHFERLRSSGEAIGIAVPLENTSFASILETLIQENALTDAYIRTIVTGGESSSGYALSDRPTVLIRPELAAPVDSNLLTKGVSLMTLEYTREIPHAKTIHYIEALKNEPLLRESGAFEMLFVHKGSVLECSRSNIFLVSNGSLITPEDSILRGITRKVVLDEARAIGIPAIERSVSLDELVGADEVFVTATGKGVVPVVRIDDRVVSEGIPGPVTRTLVDRFAHIRNTYA